MQHVNLANPRSNEYTPPSGHQSRVLGQTADPLESILLASMRSHRPAARTPAHPPPAIGM
jgi:hypothetical protein